MQLHAAHSSAHCAGLRRGSGWTIRHPPARIGHRCSCHPLTSAPGRPPLATTGCYRSGRGCPAHLRYLKVPHLRPYRCCGSDFGFCCGSDFGWPRRCLHLTNQNLHALRPWECSAYQPRRKLLGPGRLQLEKGQPEGVPRRGLALRDPDVVRPLKAPTRLPELQRVGWVPGAPTIPNKCRLSRCSGPGARMLAMSRPTW
jgi:hypothetical protein